MPDPDIVLVDRSSRHVSAARLARVTRALQTQVDRDFGLVWGVRARITAGGPVPSGAWSIVLADGATAASGIGLDGDRPCAIIPAGRDWTLAASHVLMEMIANPDGRRFIEGMDGTHGAPARRVRYLVEVCDPCEVFHYQIDGVRVSDFVTPDYFRADAAPGTAFDFLRRLRRPLEVPRGGYLSWHDTEDGRWHQTQPDGSHSISRTRVDPDCDPRADRDAHLDGDERHDVQAIVRTYPARRGRRLR